MSVSTQLWMASVISSLSICSFSLLAVLLRFSFKLKSLCSLCLLLLPFPSLWNETRCNLVFQICLSDQRASSVLLFSVHSIRGSICGCSRRWKTKTSPWQRRIKLFVPLNSTKRSTNGRLYLSFSEQTLWTNKRIILKASLTDGAAVDQKASLTFQSATAQIRRPRPFPDESCLSGVVGG